MNPEFTEHRLRTDQPKHGIVYISQGPIQRSFSGRLEHSALDLRDLLVGELAVQWPGTAGEDLLARRPSVRVFTGRTDTQLDAAAVNC